VPEQVTAPERVAASPAAQAAPAAQPQVTAEVVTESLLALIADRTGYPTEMLEPTLDLEADLGIDSIKRVEILGALRNRWLAEAGEAARERMGPVARERTVERIVARFMDVVAEFAGGAAAAPAAVSTTAPAAPQAREEAEPDLIGQRTDLSDWQARFVIVPRRVAAKSPKPVLKPSHAYIVTGPDSPLRAVLKIRIEAAGATPLLVETVDDAEIRSAIASGDLEIGGVFHLWSARSRPELPEMAPSDWSDAVTEDLRSLYSVLSAAGERLAATADAFVVAASRMGGAFGFDGIVAGAPNAAGAAGLLKSARKEWESLTIRAVDFEPGLDAEEMARLLIDEAGRPEGAAEIGWKGDLRLELVAEPRFLRYDAARPVEGLGPENIVLVTGGARGITARVVKHLAEHHSPRFVLMGSTPLDAEIPPDLAGLSDPREIRGKLVARRKAEGRPVAPAEIEAETRQIVRAGEIAETLASVRAAGCNVDYMTVNVRDAEAFDAAIQEVYARHGRIDVAIHAAGVIDDKLIVDKTLDSFEHVVRTKTDSAFTLVRALRRDEVKAVVFFASVAGRFGNRGQGDYGAGNEIVSKLARTLDAAWPGRVVAISWGPWDSGGMVTDEIKAQFMQLGIEAIDPALGVAALEVELQQGSKGEPEVVWGRGPWGYDAAAHLKVAE
jgi:NAD(P)-dependent dehydrogenase (short-subunit alcohol dehydrogenase family)